MGVAAPPRLHAIKSTLSVHETYRCFVPPSRSKTWSTGRTRTSAVRLFTMLLTTYIVTAKTRVSRFGSPRLTRVATTASLSKRREEAKSWETIADEEVRGAGHPELAGSHAKCLAEVPGQGGHAEPSTAHGSEEDGERRSSKAPNAQTSTAFASAWCGGPSRRQSTSASSAGESGEVMASSGASGMWRGGSFEQAKRAIRADFQGTLERATRRTDCTMSNYIRLTCKLSRRKDVEGPDHRDSAANIARVSCTKRLDVQWFSTIGVWARRLLDRRTKALHGEAGLEHG